MSGGQPDFVGRLLSNRYNRRVFTFTMALMLVTLLITRIFVLPIVFNEEIDFFGPVVSVFNALFATGVVTLVVAVLFFWLTPSVGERAEMEVIAAHEISDKLEAARATTRDWWYSGGLGRFTTSVTVPRLLERASNSNTTQEVTLLIIDPADADLCRRYADYKNSLRSTRGSPWTAEKIRNEAMASLLLTAYWNGQSTRLEVTAGLKRNFSIFRIDLSSEHVVITKADPQDPALKTDAGTFFYNSYREEIRNALAQSTTVPIDVAVSDLSSASVTHLVEQLPVELDALTEPDIDQIADLAAARDNPYA